MKELFSAEKPSLKNKGWKEKITQRSKTFIEIQDWVIELPLQCRPYDENLYKARMKQKWVLLDEVFNILDERIGGTKNKDS